MEPFLRRAQKGLACRLLTFWTALLTKLGGLLAFRVRQQSDLKGGPRHDSRSDEMLTGAMIGV
jgi:hypothetical protein